MKAITMRIQKTSRPGVILLATVVAIITSIVVANATQTITTPNAAFISYNLAVGANSAAITPASSRAVLVIGCCTTNGVQSVGQATLHHIPGGAIDWVGLESATGLSSTTTTTAGGSATFGTHIVYLDSNQSVDIEVASADTILIHSAPNFNNTARAGNVTLVW